MDKSTVPVSIIYGGVSVAALVILGAGVYAAMTPPHTLALLAAGCVSLIAVGVTWPIAHWLARGSAAQREAGLLVHQLQERIERISQSMNRISEQQLLSDRAKSVAYRDKDREAIRRAIHEEMGHGEWEAAFALADQFEQAFGSKSEADRFRSEIRERQAEGVRMQVAEVMTVIDRHTRAEQWSAALREAEKLMKRFPNEPQVKQLPQEIENRRAAHKRQLLASWHEAVARHDVDGSIEILKQLDAYLTPAEAESMQDTARSVFKEKLNNLGAEFAAAIRDHKWTQAVQLGEQIQREFPNARIAQEVQEKMAALRQRANEPAAAAAS